MAGDAAIKNAGVFVFDKCETIDRSRDTIYDTAFVQRLSRPVDATGGYTIPYSGYLRALQLYGNEEAFELSPQERDNLRNCKNLEFCRSLARNQGYNPDSGKTAPWAGVYFPYPHVQLYPGPLIAILPTSDVEQAPSRKQVSSSTDTDAQSNPSTGEATQDTDTTGSPSLENSFVTLHMNDPTKPVTLRGMSGSRVPMAEDFGNTCVGGMEMAVVVTELLERAVKGDLDDEWKSTIKNTLEYIGGSENMAAFLSTMYNRFPKKKDTSAASTIGRRLRGPE
ncbi:hypothetical protein F53441_11824 [Fusarium austroafricanum]|uniref:Uncharacterized protein n=1 Tax=Fusarium austroafricanum TaxID=2364996 RepID=A0A8H4K1Z7_9HYPO|nr:hypothetical protein F53441_11824 [Fusarium austroafricanum]